MSIYVISDLHLSFHENKPMDIFGENWQGHEEKIKKDWCQKVKEEDMVLLPGDFSWSMQLQDTYQDFEYLHSLPGKKLLLKGNHDYWWTTLTNMRKYLKENQFEDIDFIYNNSYCYENHIIVGTRGWNLADIENDSKIIKREAIRLELSLQEGIKQFGKEKPIIVCMHYPPVTKQKMQSAEADCFMRLMKEYGVKKCYYGHLHGKSHLDAVEGNIDGIELQLVSADYLDFKLVKLC